MFTGQFEHNIDAKGRVIIPAKYREELGSLFYIAKEQDDCLGVYKKELWEEYVDKLNKLPTSNAIARKFKRFILAGACECEPDSNGRIMLPPSLREYAGITKEIVSTGNGDKVEIWDKARWDKEQSGKLSDDEFGMLVEYGI